MMKLSDTDLSREMREAVEATMQPGEELVHAEAPQVPFLVDLNGGNAGYGIALVVMVFAGIVLYQEGETWENPVILSTIAIVVLSIQLRVHALRRGARYLLTTRQAVICKSGFFGGIKLRTYTLQPNVVEEVETNRHGRGHIIFDYTDYSVNGQHLPIGFLWLANVSTTQQILQKLLDECPPLQAVSPEEEELPEEQHNAGLQQAIAAVICFIAGSIAVYLGISEATALPETASTERLISALFPALVGTFFLIGGFAALYQWRRSKP